MREKPPTVINLDEGRAKVKNAFFKELSVIDENITNRMNNLIQSIYASNPAHYPDEQEVPSPPSDQDYLVEMAFIRQTLSQARTELRPSRRKELTDAWNATIEALREVQDYNQSLIQTNQRIREIFDLIDSYSIDVHDETIRQTNSNQSLKNFSNSELSAEPASSNLSKHIKSLLIRDPVLDTADNSLDYLKFHLLEHFRETHTAEYEMSEEDRVMSARLIVETTIDLVGDSAKLNISDKILDLVLHEAYEQYEREIN